MRRIECNYIVHYNYSSYYCETRQVAGQKYSECIKMILEDIFETYQTNIKYSDAITDGYKTIGHYKGREKEEIITFEHIDNEFRVFVNSYSEYYVYIDRYPITVLIEE